MKDPRRSRGWDRGAFTLAGGPRPTRLHVNFLLARADESATAHRMLHKVEVRKRASLREIAWHSGDDPSTALMADLSCSAPPPSRPRVDST